MVGGTSGLARRYRERRVGSTIGPGAAAARAGRGEDLMSALSQIFPTKATIVAASRFGTITPR